MSKFEDDLARGCLPTGEPLECLYGTGWWTKIPAEEPDPVDLHIAVLEARIAELEADNAEFRQLIRDWSIVLDQNNGFQLWQVESVRQAMLEINKESELREYIDELETEKECEMRVFKDGNAWCFVLPDFQDLQVSSSVWMKEGVLDKIYKELRSVKNERQSASND